MHQPKKAAKQSSMMYYAIEFNLLLWLMASGCALRKQVTTSAAWSDLEIVMLIGTLFAAIGQHWVYYATFRRVPTEPENSTTG